VSDLEEDNASAAAVRMVSRAPSNTLLRSQAVREAWEAKERCRAQSSSTQIVPVTQEEVLEGQDSVVPPSRGSRHAWQTSEDDSLETSAREDPSNVVAARVQGEVLTASRSSRHVGNCMASDGTS
jgi:hypothetical protein